MFKMEQLSEDVTLYLGDCREVIPTLSPFNTFGIVRQGDPRIPASIAVISDPPYGTEDLVQKYSRSIAGMKTAERLIANDKNLDCVVETLNLIKSQFDNIWLALFYSCRISPVFFQATSMLDYYGEIIWDKKVMGMGDALRYQHENIGIFKLGKPEDFANTTSLFTYLVLKGDKKGGTADNKSDVHPHEKPLQVMHNICRVVPGKIILDPFMGTGSTGAAAVQNGKGFIGVEYIPKYFDQALKKVSDALKQPVNFWEM